MSGGADTPAMADDELLALARHALDRNPSDGGAWSTLGVVLRRQGRLAGAIASHRRGLEHDPRHAGIWSNLGNALLDVGRVEEAMLAQEEALRLDSTNPVILFNAVAGLRKAGHASACLALLDRLAALGQDSPSVIWERALARLQVGDYARGFADYEARLTMPGAHTRPAPGPTWDGGLLGRRTLFLATEQGFGDALLAARYVPLIAARGGRVILECHAELQRVLSGLPVEAFHRPGTPRPSYDVQAMSMSLPGLMGTRREFVPPPVGLTVPPEARAKAARLVGPADPGTIRVGLVWSGRTTFGENRLRATSLARLLALAEIPGVRFYSLQKGPPEAEIEVSGVDRIVVPLGPALDDFADTAACIERLDLVVMTDSAVAHLCGSLGRPVWNLLQHVPYWIYGLSGEDTPWYPSMRLFRQDRGREWDAVVARVGDALRHLAERRRTG